MFEVEVEVCGTLPFYLLSTTILNRTKLVEVVVGILNPAQE